MIKNLKTWTRFRLTSALPDGAVGQLEDAIELQRFVPPASPASLETRAGWVSTSNMLDTDFKNLNDWLFNHYLFLALRIDKKVLPAKLFAAEVKRRQEAWKKEHNRPRVPGSVKEEMKEQVRIEMATRTLPQTTLVPVMWNLDANYVLIGTHSTAHVELVCKIFQRTFERVLERVDLGVITEAVKTEWFDGQEPADMWRSEFLAWLWRMAEQPVGDVRWWLGEKLILSNPNEAKPNITIRDVDSARVKAAFTALQAGAQVIGLRLCIRVEDREYALSLDKDLRISGAKLPVLVRTGDAAEHIYDRMFLIEDLTYQLENFRERFYVMRSDSATWAAYQNDFAAWCVEAMTPKPKVAEGADA